MAERASKLKVCSEPRVVEIPQLEVYVPEEEENQEIMSDGPSLDQLQVWSAQSSASRASPERHTLSFPSEDVEYGLHQKNAKKRRHRHAMKQSKMGNSKRQKR